MLYYYAVDANRPAGAGYTEQELFDFAAFKTACYVNQLWTQYQHDVAMSNIYALIVLLAKVAPEELKSVDPTAFMDMVEAASDQALEEAADEMPFEMLPIPNKEQREKFYKQCSLMLNMHHPKMTGRNQLNFGTNNFHIMVKSIVYN